MTDLAAYAAHDFSSRGRIYPEPQPAYRGAFQRDRDRIVHSAAFRRLEYKTQVFVNHEGDMFRTRLTHTLEVAQISRTVARALLLNEDLTEAIALAHDLGHTPFGHAGQDALNDCMRSYGGFEHNAQSLRVVDLLEERYAQFPGLNLTFEAREGILKHCSLEWANQLGELGQRFIIGRQPSLEAQVANIADEIAYNNHDVDDGLRAGLITLNELDKIALFRRQRLEVEKEWPGIGERRLIHEIIRRMINQQVVGLIEYSGQVIASASPSDIEAVRKAPCGYIGFSHDLLMEHKELKAFLMRHLYRHYRVRRMSMKAGRILRSLFEAFMNDMEMLPPETGQRVAQLDHKQGQAGRARGIADYIAGMTDRYAILEFQRIFSVSHLT
jgi:dGTPase